MIMTEKKLTRAEALARAHAGNRRKRLNRIADELRENGFFVLTPEEAESQNLSKLPKAA